MKDAGKGNRHSAKSEGAPSAGGMRALRPRADKGPRWSLRPDIAAANAEREKERSRKEAERESAKADRQGGAAPSPGAKPSLDAAARVTALAEEVGGNLGYDIEDVELLGKGRRTLLRVTIDKMGGVGIEDCAAFSRAFEALMDVEDPIRGTYTLEVSSPGLDRALKKTRDYLKSLGKAVRLVLNAQMDGQGFLTGTLDDVSDERCVLLVDGRVIEVPRDNIKRARLEPELGKR